LNNGSFISMIDLQISSRIATVTLDRPPANALNATWVERFHQILDELEQRDDWSVMHVRSALRLFCAGADIKEMREAFGTAGGSDRLAAMIPVYQQLFDRIEALPHITLAELNGAATGGGFELALACDLRIVADEARVGLPEVRIGLLAGAGGTQRLTRLCGRATAIRLLAGAEIVDGQTAVSLGLCQWSAPASELQARAQEIAERFAGHDPLASRLVKQCVNAAMGHQDRRGFELEHSGSQTLFASERTRALILSFLDQLSARKKN
jgi:enoyl-CoA hydratase/carnithine racemase